MKMITPISDSIFKKLNEEELLLINELYLDMVKYKNVIDKIKEYVKNDYDRNQEVVDYCGFDKFYNYILELLEEVG